MRRLIATFLLAAFGLLTATFAGLSLFGMQMMSDMGDGCVGMHCAPMSDSAPGDLGCINHCISSASALSGAVLPVPLASVILVIAAFLGAFLGATILPVAAAMAQTDRWREGIGKAFRHQSIATVILRN